MAKIYDLNLYYKITFTVNHITAPTQKLAVKKARNLIENATHILTDFHADASDLKYDRVIWIEGDNGSWKVKIAYGLIFSATDISAYSEERAVKIAKEIISHTTIYTDHNLAGDISLARAEADYPKFHHCIFVKSK